MRKESFFPIYCDVLVPFDIFMPSRLQQKYSSTIPVVETFHVMLMYYGGMPVVDISLYCGCREKRSENV